MADLSCLRVAILAADDFEEPELTEPLRALREAGARVDVVSPHAGQIQAVRHDEKSIKVDVDRTLEDARPDDYDAVVLPGGALNADQIRMDPRAQAFVRDMDLADKPLAVICHAPWLLASAGLVDGRHMTSYHTIQDDLRNAGAHWEDREVVRDGNWVSSRQPSDLPAFNREMLSLFGEACREREPALAGR